MRRDGVVIGDDVLEGVELAATGPQRVAAHLVGVAAAHPAVHGAGDGHEDAVGVADGIDAGGAVGADIFHAAVGDAAGPSVAVNGSASPLLIERLGNRRVKSDPVAVDLGDGAVPTDGGVAGLEMVGLA